MSGYNPTTAEKAPREAVEAITEGHQPNLPQPDKTAKRANMHRPQEPTP